MKEGAGPVYFFGPEAGPVLGMLPGRRIALFLDFDGTLVPIQKDPDRCALSEETKDQLRALAGSGRHFVSVLSGRALSDIKSRVGIQNICYGGNHGLVISGNGLRFVHQEAARAMRAIDRAAQKLNKEITVFSPGAWVEQKKYSVSLHYRLAGKKAVPELKRIFHEVAADVSAGKLLAVMKGKKVLELMPASWDKGQAVLWMLNRLEGGYLPMFIGDDVTDEAAFRELKKRGITIRVGKSKSTLANFYLKNRQEVYRLLEAIRA